MYLTEEPRFIKNLWNFVGNNQIFQQIFELARELAPTPAPVPITGATERGKELLAQLLHELSPHNYKPFIRVNCTALPSGLVDSELFGNEKGAFIGAEIGRPGKFELANGGTLFLNEIGEMPIEVQAKILKVLQEGMVEGVDSIEGKDIYVRTIAATNTDLSKAMAEGRFRSDLFYRLHVFPIVVPPLRDRLHDILLPMRNFAQ